VCSAVFSQMSILNAQPRGVLNNESEHEPWGVLNIESKHRDSLGDADFYLISIFADLLAQAFQITHRNHQRIIEAQDAT